MCLIVTVDFPAVEEQSNDITPAAVSPIAVSIASTKLPVTAAGEADGAFSLVAVVTTAVTVDESIDAPVPSTTLPAVSLY